MAIRIRCFEHRRLQLRFLRPILLFTVTPLRASSVFDLLVFLQVQLLCLSREPSILFCEVDEDYIQDDFSLFRLSIQDPYEYALDLISDVILIMEIVKASGNVFGKNFQVSTFGVSHGGGVGCTISGCPRRIPLTAADMQVELDRRRPGQSRITTPRKETDKCQILSGVSEGMTTGTHIHVFVPNTDQRGNDYTEMSKACRPSHADATYDFKYGLRSVQGGGRSSARETIGRVAAGAVAKKNLKMKCGT